MSELVSYIETCRRYPWQAIKEILTCAFILALMFGALFFKEIMMWAEGVIR